MNLRRGANKLAIHNILRTSAEGSSQSQSQSDTNPGRPININIGLRWNTLTRVILSSCIPLITLLLLLAIFTTTSESASLTNKPKPTDHSNQNQNDNDRPVYASQTTGGHHTLTSISNGHTYMYQIPPAYRSIQKVPKVLLRLSSESGILRPNPPHQRMSTTVKPTQNNVETSYQNPKYSAEGDLSIEEDKSDLQEEDQGDYPYQFYLDFDENASQQQQQAQSQSKSEFLPLPSETVLHKAQYDQYNQHHQNSNAKNIWSDFLSLSQITTTPHSPTNDINFNEVYDPNDNYTIPSLRDYKFPEFKSLDTSTKSNYLNPYEFFSEEDLENVADLEGDHSKYFVKTKPRDVSSSIANIYNSFYYEPPSYSTKTQPLPVKATFPLANGQVEGGGSGNKLDYYGSLKHFRNTNDETTFTFPIQQTTPITTPLPIMTEMFTSPSAPVTLQSSTTTSTTTTLENKTTSDSSTAESIISSNQIVTPPSISITSDLNLIPDIVSKQTTTDATSIPGMPGIDYPIFDEIPTTSFDCQKQRYKGFFADIDTKCQAWHYCDFTDGHSTFLCPNGTLFSQVLLTCDWWFNVNCKQAQQLYVLNERLYRYIKPPKPSFPEDYHGPQVDLWLLKQLELGLLPKIKKRGKVLVDKPVVVPNT